MPKTTGQTLRNARIKKQMSAQTAAMKLGVQYKTYLAWERGDRTPPMRYLDALMDLFEGDVDYSLIAVMANPRPNTPASRLRNKILPKNMPQGRHTLAQLRVAKGMTQDTVAEILGVSLSTYQKWESCKRAVNQNCHAYEFRNEIKSQWDRLVEFFGEEPWDTLVIPFMLDKTAHRGPVSSIHPVISGEREAEFLDTGHVTPRQY